MTIGNLDLSPSEIALREKLNAEFFDPPEYASLRTSIDNQFKSVAVRDDDTKPWGEGNRQKVKAVLVVGATRAGKTHAVEQALGEQEPVDTVDGQVVTPRPVKVECSSIFDIGDLGVSLLQALVYGAKRAFKSTEAWNRVRTQLGVFKPTQILIDEYGYSFHPTGVGPKSMGDKRVEIQGQFRSLLDLPLWPTPLVLVGPMKVIDYLEDPAVKHIKEKIRDIIRISPMTWSDADIGLLREALTTLCKLAGVNCNIPEEDFFRRLCHSSGDARGLALDVIKDAAVVAARGESKTLEMRHFADLYRLHTGAADVANPFIETNWLATDPNRLLDAVDGVERTPQVASPKHKK
jgi:hypothetical protein